MSLPSRSVIRIGVLAGLVLGIAPAALASRPATTLHVAHSSRAVEIGAGRYVSGGGRGGRQLAARRDTPAQQQPQPTTRAADAASGGVVLASAGDARRRGPQSRATSPIAPSSRLRLVRLVDDVRDRRAAAPSAVFHDAHAPPLPVTDVAGLLA